MKKTLVTITGLLAILSLMLSFSYNAKAMTDLEWRHSFGSYYGDDDYTTPPLVTGDQSKIGFRTDWQQARDFGVKPINVGDDKIEIKTYPKALIKVYKTSPTGESDSLYEVTNDFNSEDYRMKFTLANDSGIATFDLKQVGIYDKQKTKFTKKEVKTEKGDKYFVVASYDGFTLGSGEWIVGKSKPRDKVEEEEKQYQLEMSQILEQFEQQEQEREALELFNRSREVEEGKTWYQRLGDSIQDQWWNFKGWVYGPTPATSETP